VWSENPALNGPHFLVLSRGTRPGNGSSRESGGTQGRNAAAQQSTHSNGQKTGRATRHDPTHNSKRQSKSGSTQEPGQRHNASKEQQPAGHQQQHGEETNSRHTFTSQSTHFLADNYPNLYVSQRYRPTSKRRGRTFSSSRPGRHGGGRTRETQNRSTPNKSDDPSTSTFWSESGFLEFDDGVNHALWLSCLCSTV
jgi:hypothetical protein